MQRCQFSSNADFACFVALFLISWHSDLSQGDWKKKQKKRNAEMLEVFGHIYDMMFDKEADQ